ncbi:MAG: fimbria/pilus outer membrane usher protein [Idiomarina sp.]|nr:fimbria/pilus outer membrane usher protein [Idiomarina sp.]
MRSFIPTILLLLVTMKSYAAVFPVALEYDGVEIGYVTIDYQNNQAEAVLASDLVEIFENQLNQDALTALNEFNFASLEELAQLGFGLEFRPRTMDIALIIEPHLLRRSSIDMQGGSGFRANLEDPANWAKINNFNIAASHDNRSEVNRLNFDWQGAINVGGIRGLNLTWSAGADYDDFTRELATRRGFITLFNDQPRIPLRTSVGDLNTSVAGHLSGASLLGVGLTSAYYELQPYTRISPSSVHQLILRERAEVEVFVNGRLVNALRLAPGQYDLTDIPLNEGANDVEVTVYYVSGEIENLVFSQFYNARLLRAGMNNFGFNAGKRSEFTGIDGLSYTDENLATGFYERGLTNWLTVGVNGQYHDDGTVIGGQLGVASLLGNFSLRHSQSDTLDVDGTASSIDWQFRFIGAREGAPNLRVAFEHYSMFNNQPWNDDFFLSGSRWVANYALYFGQRTELRFNYQESQITGDRRRITKEALLSYRTPRTRFGVGVRQGDFGMSATEDFEAFATVELNLSDRSSGRRYFARYDSWYEEIQLGLSRPGRQAVGDFSYDLRHTEGDSQRITSLRSGYSGNRFRASTSANYLEAGGVGYYGVGGQMSTAVGWADGRFGWGRPGNGPFTVVTSHRSLGRAPVLLNDNRYGVEAIATSRAGALLTSRSRFKETRLLVDVPDAPIGYDWGGGQYFTIAGAHTATHIEVGSDAFYSLIGTLVDSSGEPLSLEVARVEGEGIKQVVFTNRAGRFIAEGLRPGNYILTTTQAPVRSYKFSILESEDMLQRIGELQPDENP